MDRLISEQELLKHFDPREDWAVVQTIKAIPSAEPCEDAISRQAVFNKIKEVCFSREQEWVDFRVSQGSNGQRDFLINYIKQLPSVTQKSETVTEFADRCRECGAKYGKLLKQEPKTEQFAKWVASEIFDEWEYNKDTFAEIACRKLEKLGIVRAKGDEWELVEPQERSDKE